MTEPLTKLEQAKKLQFEIAGVDKHIELMRRIINSFAEEFNKNPEALPLPPVSVKCNPQYSNYMVLDAKYLPTETSAFWTAYMKRAQVYKEKLQKDLEILMN